MVMPELESLFQNLEKSLQNSGALELRPDRPIFLYGAGKMGRELLGLLQHAGHTVTGFLDRSAQSGQQIDGLPVMAADDARLSEQQRREAQVIVAVFNRDADPRAIEQFLATLSFGRVITFPEMHAAFQTELGDRFWLTPRHRYLGWKREIAEADALWTDEHSRDVFRSILAYRFSLKSAELPTTEGHQYFPLDLPPWSLPLRLADCGAFDGDTLRGLVQDADRFPVEAVAAFEPDPANYAKLTEFAHSDAWPSSNTICLYPCAVGARTELLRFSTGQGEAGSVAAAGGELVPCVALDGALAGFRPNLIKMDIEGAELDALQGARGLITRHRPGLAICVYHRPEHLWEIPFFIRDLLPGGSHHLRAHGQYGLDLIYYWCP